MTEPNIHEMRVDVGGGREQIRRVDYPSNSKIAKLKNKQENETPVKPPVERIVTGPVERRKPGVASRVLKTFIVEDSGSIFEYLVMEVFVPAAKNTISDLVTGALQQAFYGGRRQPGVGGRPGYTSYNRVNVPPDPGGVRSPLSRQARATHDFSDVILKTRAEADDVLELMRSMIEQYQMVSVNDLYDMLGLTGDFTDAKWGWTDLRSAKVRPIQGGYLLELPETAPLT